MYTPSEQQLEVEKKIKKQVLKNQAINIVGHIKWWQSTDYYLSKIAELICKLDKEEKL